MDINAFIDLIREQRKAAGLTVLLDRETTLSFSTAEKRDEFIRRAKRLGHEAEIVVA